MLRIFKRNRQESLKQTEEGVKASRDRWFGRILGILRNSRLDDSVWEELEEVLISSDVGVDTSLRVIENLKARVKNDHLEDPEAVFQALKETLALELEYEDATALWLDESEQTSPYVILMVGVNGVGKTTSIAKLAHHLSQAGKKVILGAADTYRAAGAEQARQAYERAVELFRNTGLIVATGRFQEYMQVRLQNDGPVTIMLDSADRSRPRRG